jgi:DNA-binding transcriptional MerR regulator
VVKVGIGVLAADTGETVRALQHWCDLGVLVAEPSTEKKGRGYHREFKDDERKWALLASALNKLRVPLADIAKYLEFLRSYYTVENLGKDDARNAQRLFDASPISQALKSDRDVFMMLSLQTDKKGLEVKMSLFEPIDTEPIKLLKPLPRPRRVISSLRTRSVDQQIRFSRETPQCYFLNLTQIWAPLRPPA